MNHHDIRLIEIGQKEGYARAVREIVALVAAEFGRLPYSQDVIEQIEAKFGGRDAGRSA